MSSSSHINYSTLISRLDELDEETFFEITIGGSNQHGSMDYFNVKYNKNFANPSATPKYQVMWGYEIDPEDRVYYSGINSRTDTKSAKIYNSGSIPKTDNVEHTALSEFLIRAIICALRKCVDLPTQNLKALAEVRKILKDEDFPTIKFKPHYAETYYDKSKVQLVAMEQPRATFEFDGSTWAISSKMPESLSGNVKSRIYTIATAEDVEAMKEKGFNKRKITAYEENLPAEDDDEETIERKLIARYKTGAIPRPWDSFKTKPITAIGGNSGHVFGQINFPGALQLYQGNIRVKPSFGKCTFIPDPNGSNGDSSSKYMDDDEEMLAFSRATAKTTRVVKGSKGTGKLAGDSDEEEAPKKSTKKAVVIEDDEDQKPKKTVTKKKAPVVTEEEDDEEVTPPPKKTVPKKKAPVVTEEEDDEEVTPPPKKTAPKKKAPVVTEEEDDEDVTPPPKKTVPKKKAPVEEEDDEDASPPPKKTATKKAPKKAPPKKTEDSDYDDDE